MKRQIAWNALVWAAASLAAWGAQRAVRYTWARFSDSDNPSNPLDDSTSWQEAAAMALTLGLAVALARKVSRRGAEEVWRMATKEAPPGAV